MNSLQQKLDGNNSIQNLHQNNIIDMNVDQQSTSDINHPIDGYTNEQHKRLLHRVINDADIMEDEQPQHHHRKLYTIENPRSNIIQQQNQHDMATNVVEPQQNNQDNQQDMATNVVEKEQNRYNNQDISNIIIDQPVSSQSIKFAADHQPTTIDMQYPRHLQRDQEPDQQEQFQEQFEKNVQSMFGIGQQQTETADNQYYTQQSYDPFATTADSISQSSHDVNTSAFLTAFYVNIVVFIVLIGCYELFRKWFPSVYSPRTTVIGRSSEPSSKRNSDKGEESDSERSSTSSPSGLTSFNVTKSIISNRVDHIINTSQPLSWIPGVCRASWSTVRSSGGLDSYMFLRYVRLCFRITFTSALWGLIILWPVYATSDGGANGWYFLSMANITQESHCFNLTFV